MTAHCKKCNNKTFTTLSALRKHQWKAHRESYAGLLNAHKTKALTIAIEAKSVNMTVEQLINRLREQRDFMKDVVDLVETLAAK